MGCCKFVMGDAEWANRRTTDLTLPGDKDSKPAGGDAVKCTSSSSSETTSTTLAASEAEDTTASVGTASASSGTSSSTGRGGLSGAVGCVVALLTGAFLIEFQCLGVGKAVGK